MSLGATGSLVVLGQARLGAFWMLGAGWMLAVPGCHWVSWCRRVAGGAGGGRAGCWVQGGCWVSLGITGCPDVAGSLAVLARAGLGARWVLVVGLGGSLPVLPGLYAGLALGAAGPARTWLGALATGVLLHLALGDMVSAGAGGGRAGFGYRGGDTWVPWRTWELQGVGYGCHGCRKGAKGAPWGHGCHGVV